MSVLVKKCSCGQNNDEGAVFCSSCGADISAMPCVAATPPTNTAVSKRKDHGGDTGGKRACPKCGAVHDAPLSLCRECGAVLESPDSTTLAPQRDAEPGCRDQETAAPDDGKLFLSIGRQEFECHDGDVLGREGTVACHVFSGIGEVSRQHVAISRRENRWWITALSTNLTELDGRKFGRGTSVAITNEHVLKMSKKCEVQLRVGLGGKREFRAGP